MIAAMQYGKMFLTIGKYWCGKSAVTVIRYSRLFPEMIADILDSFATEIQQLDESQPLGKMLSDIHRTTGWFSLGLSLLNKTVT